MTPVSEAKKRANNKWVQNHYKRVNLAVSFEEMERIEKYCNENNFSKNSFFLTAAREKLEREEK